MGEDFPEQPLDSVLAGARTSEAMKRAACRRLFREMVRGETEHGPIGFFRRRALVRFAGRLSIASAEARLIIRGVEYEVGLAKAGSAAELLAKDKRASRLRLEQLESVLRIGLIILIAMLYIFLFRWVVAVV